MLPHRSAQLSAGQKAPNFTVRDVRGKRVSLNQLKTRYTLLVFLRYSGCPWCNLALHRLSLEYARLRQYDCEVIAFIQSDKAAIMQNIYGRHAVKPEFSIIADKALHYYNLYGVERHSSLAAVRSITKIPAWVHAVKQHGFKQGSLDGEFFLVPASFLIDNRSQQVRRASYGSNFYDTDTFIDIYQSVYFNEL